MPAAAGRPAAHSRTAPPSPGRPAPGAGRAGGPPVRFFVQKPRKARQSVRRNTRKTTGDTQARRPKTPRYEDPRSLITIYINSSRWPKTTRYGGLWSQQPAPYWSPQGTKDYPVRGPLVPHIPGRWSTGAAKDHPARGPPVPAACPLLVASGDKRPPGTGTSGPSSLPLTGRLRGQKTTRYGDLRSQQPAPYWSPQETKDYPVRGPLVPAACPLLVASGDKRLPGTGTSGPSSLPLTGRFRGQKTTRYGGPVPHIPGRRSTGAAKDHPVRGPPGPSLPFTSILPGGQRPPGTGPSGPSLPFTSILPGDKRPPGTGGGPSSLPLTGRLRRQKTTRYEDLRSQLCRQGLKCTGQKTTRYGDLRSQLCRQGLKYTGQETARYEDPSLRHSCLRSPYRRKLYAGQAKAAGCSRVSRVWARCFMWRFRRCFRRFYETGFLSAAAARRRPAESPEASHGRHPGHCPLAACRLPPGVLPSVLPELLKQGPGLL